MLRPQRCWRSFADAKKNKPLLPVPLLFLSADEERHEVLVRESDSRAKKERAACPSRPFANTKLSDQDYQVNLIIPWRMRWPMVLSAKPKRWFVVFSVPFEVKLSVKLGSPAMKVRFG